MAEQQESIYLFISPPPHGIMIFSFMGGLMLLIKATGAAREPTPHPFTTVGEPIPRTGRHRELNPGPLDLQTNALPTELTGRFRGVRVWARELSIYSIECTA